MVTSPWASAFNYFTSQGWSPVQAAGILGGLKGETANLDNNAVHDNGIGLGIAGWNGPRLAALKAYAASKGTQLNDLQTQLEFVNQELRTSEAGAGNRLSAAKTPAEAGNAMLAYERPNNWNVPGAHPERAQYAQQFYNQFGGVPIAGPQPQQTAQSQPQQPQQPQPAQPQPTPQNQAQPQQQLPANLGYSPAQAPTLNMPFTAPPPIQSAVPAQQLMRNLMLARAFSKIPTPAGFHGFSYTG